MTRVKICCISSVEEARLAINHGASALGLVSKMPSGPGVIEETLITEIAESVPPGVSTFLLTSKQNVEEIIHQQKRCRTNTIQLCDRLLIGSHKELKNALPGIKIVQVVHVVGEESIEEAIEVSENVDAILLDSGNQKLKIKELGGTGRTHDWDISKKIRESINVPLFLAGGLNPNNVVEAINIVKPYGVDICSGVRTNGNLDEEKLKLFFENIRITEK
jgi:phosphoribosylanthranilate isomerase